MDVHYIYGISIIAYLHIMQQWKVIFLSNILPLDDQKASGYLNINMRLVNVCICIEDQESLSALSIVV